MTDVSEAVCEKCGGPVEEGEEGQVVCSGCHKSSSMCDCGGRTPTVSAPPDREGPEG